MVTTPSAPPTAEKMFGPWDPPKNLPQTANFRRFWEGQIMATSHDLTPEVKSPYFRKIQVCKLLYFGQMYGGSRGGWLCTAGRGKLQMQVDDEDVARLAHHVASFHQLPWWTKVSAMLEDGAVMWLLCFVVTWIANKKYYKPQRLTLEPQNSGGLYDERPIQRGPCSGSMILSGAVFNMMLWW